MPIYISLMKFTDQGIKNIKDAPGRAEQAVKDLEAMGGRLVGLYSVMGEYDYVTITECPSDEVASIALLALGAQGNIRTTTFKAFTKEEFAEMVKKLP